MAMAEARGKSEWARTSSLMALLANCHRDPKRQRKAFAPMDFSPYRRERKARRAGGVSWEAWGRALIGESRRRRGLPPEPREVARQKWGQGDGASTPGETEGQGDG